MVIFKALLVVENLKPFHLKFLHPRLTKYEIMLNFNHKTAGYTGVYKQAVKRQRCAARPQRGQPKRKALSRSQTHLAVYSNSLF